jgi:hypothetical protein
MGSLIEELAAREAAARVRVGELEAEIAELASRLEAERETLSRLVITRETVAEVMAETSLQEAEEETEETVQPAAVAAAASSSPFAGAEARVIGVLTVPRWQPGLGVEGAAEDVPGHRGGGRGRAGAGAGEADRAEGRAAGGDREDRGNQVEAEAAGGTSWLDEDTPGLFTPARRRGRESANSG